MCRHSVEWKLAPNQSNPSHLHMLHDTHCIDDIVCCLRQRLQQLQVSHVPNDGGDAEGCKPVSFCLVAYERGDFKGGEVWVFEEAREDRATDVTYR